MSLTNQKIQNIIYSLINSFDFDQKRWVKSTVCNKNCRLSTGCITNDSELLLIGATLDLINKENWQMITQLTRQSE